MDLLFKRYASPFLLLDEMIISGRLFDFVVFIIDSINKENDEKVMWEYFLHKVIDKSYADFVNECKNTKKPESDEVKTTDFETTVKQSISILNGFKV